MQGVIRRARALMGRGAVLWVGSFGLLVVSCRPGSHEETAELGASVPDARELPPLALRDETDHLLLTWVEKNGDFKVAQRIADVPQERREHVRVVVTTQDVGTGSLVYVADLRQKGANGNYAVKTMPRAAWEEVGASLRKSRMEALSPSAVAARPASAPSAAEPATPAVVVYGSETCPACREALRYFASRGIKAVAKQIDESDGARAEMVEKLRRANMPNNGSIPVLDVGGKIMIGFNAGAVEQALRAKRDVQTL